MTTRQLDAADHAAELTPYLRFWVFGWRNGSVLPVGVGDKFCDLIPPLLEKKYLKTIYNCHSCCVMLTMGVVTSIFPCRERQG